MTFELWDRSSGNRIGEFSEADQAYELVAEILEDEGVASASALMLMVEDDEGHSSRVADGPRLIGLVRGGATVATA